MKITFEEWAKSDDYPRQVSLFIDKEGMIIPFRVTTKTVDSIKQFIETRKGGINFQYAVLTEFKEDHDELDMDEVIMITAGMVCRIPENFTDDQAMIVAKLKALEFLGDDIYVHCNKISGNMTPAKLIYKFGHNVFDASAEFAKNCNVITLNSND